MSVPRLALSSPIVVRFPGQCSPWEATAGIEELALIAETADRLGFDHLTCSEHTAVPAAAEQVRGATYWDPIATLSYLAARTTRIRLATSVLVLPYHHPLEIAKRYGTLDMISGGRVVLGVGVGSLAEEFELLDAPWAGRGDRADDAIEALRASFGVREPSYAGTHYTFSGMVVEPHGVQARVPIWVGGRTLRSLRRAVRAGDGWMPFGLGTADLKKMLAQVDSPPEFEVVLPTGALDPLGTPDRVLRRLSALADAGATLAGCTVVAESAAHYCEQLAALAELSSRSGG
ncbi:F420-dependent oxidoreductase [Nocardia nova SH22a]|uniref:F420-dependent oxidoreductase n=1 Tax=Nocardia nova SH22a TaxID=1415166 RepID=W5TFZ3_9NOCA|nr:TIGR03619 family F420-dependent LLM class oxidoreductase [Nocardia nova]AHH16171.1 F420-dependent oxidoreductase [Nocardia nova SH22a]